MERAQGTLTRLAFSGILVCLGLFVGGRFGRALYERAQLESVGTRVEGRVESVSTVKTRVGGRSRTYTTLEVSFPVHGQQPARRSVSLEGSGYAQGAAVPVIYDPSDLSRVALDRPPLPRYGASSAGLILGLALLGTGLFVALPRPGDPDEGEEETLG